LFITCEDSSYQIWINKKDNGFELARTGSLPKGTGQITFADIGELLKDRGIQIIRSYHIPLDRDGTIDMLFPRCEGEGSSCELNIVYNQQIPLCSSKKKKLGDKCRLAEELCTSDANFKFEFDKDGVRQQICISFTGGCSFI
jgi:integrin alpha FG-GAP repeat containing protein 1